MKSLNNENFDNFNLFTKEMVDHIIKEGFKLKNNDSYNEELQGIRVYYKFINDINNFDVRVYIGSNGIAIDQDYDCGGNMNSTFFKFHINDFEDVYDEMVDYVNSLRDR